MCPMFCYFGRFDLRLRVYDWRTFGRCIGRGQCAAGSVAVYTTDEKYCVHVFADFVDKRAIYKAFVHNISENVDE